MAVLAGHWRRWRRRLSAAACGNAALRAISGGYKSGWLAAGLAGVLAVAESAANAAVRSRRNINTAAPAINLKKAPGYAANCGGGLPSYTGNGIFWLAILH